MRCYSFLNVICGAAGDQIASCERDQHERMIRMCRRSTLGGLPCNSSLLLLLFTYYFNIYMFPFLTAECLFFSHQNMAMLEGVCNLKSMIL